MTQADGGTDADNTRSRRRASFVVVLGIVAVAVVVAVLIAVRRDSGGSDDAGATADDTVTILWIGDTTGPAKIYGDVQLAGVRGAADYFNANGGIGGRQVEVKAVSDNADPTIAASTLLEQLALGTPTMVWAGSISADSGALIPALAQHDVFAISLIDGQAQCQQDASTECPNEWFLSNPANVVQQTVSDWMKQQGFTHVGVLEETTAYSAAETPEFVDAAAANDLTVKIASFPSTAVDVTPQMQELREDGVDVLYAEGLGSAKYVFDARASLGWDVPIVFDPAASALDLTTLTAEPNLLDAYQVSPFGQDSRTESAALTDMVTWSSTYADVTSLPLNVTGTGWDAVVALNAAVESAGGSLEVADLNAAMMNLPPTDPLRTLTHELGFSSDNHVNVLGAPHDFVVIPVGPLVDGRVKAP